MVGAPDDEYDFLADAVLRELVRGTDEFRLAAVLEEQLGEPFGRGQTPLDSDEFVADALAWFRGTPERPRT